jgi:hypothetical protein
MDPTSVSNLPLNKVVPSTPDLTSDEITKIQKNLTLLKEFNTDLWTVQGKIILDVWERFKSQYSEIEESVNNSADNKIAEVFEIPTLMSYKDAFLNLNSSDIFIELSALVLGATSSILANQTTASITGGDDLTGFTGTYSAINDANYNAMTKALDYYYTNTNDCRDYIFSYTGTDKTATLRDLINYEFTRGLYYGNWLCLCARIFRRKMVLSEMVKSKNQFLDIYFVQDGVKQGAGITSERNLNVEGVGEGVRIWSNEEINQFQSSYEQVDVYGTDNNNLNESYRKSIGEFVKKIPSAIVFPWEINNGKVYSQKYYIVSGFYNLTTDVNNPSYRLCDKEFLRWFFIDDSAGNIMNTDGVMFRYEAMRTKNVGFTNDLFLHSQEVADYNPGQENSTFSGLTFAYGPIASSKLNKEFHVYTGDLIMNNLYL